MDSSISAQVETLRLSIKVLRIGNRQVTRNILDQIPYGSILIKDWEEKTSCHMQHCHHKLSTMSKYIGWVEDTKNKEGDESKFLIFAFDGELRKSIVYRALDNDGYWVWADGSVLTRSKSGHPRYKKTLKEWEIEVADRDNQIYEDLLDSVNHLYIQA